MRSSYSLGTSILSFTKYSIGRASLGCCHCQTAVVEIVARGLFLLAKHAVPSTYHASSVKIVGAVRVLMLKALAARGIREERSVRYSESRTTLGDSSSRRITWKGMEQKKEKWLGPKSGGRERKGGKVRQARKGMTIEASLCPKHSVCPSPSCWLFT